MHKLNWFATIYQRSDNQLNRNGANKEMFMRIPCLSSENKGWQNVRTFLVTLTCGKGSKRRSTARIYTYRHAQKKYAHRVRKMFQFMQKRRVISTAATFPPLPLSFNYEHIKDDGHFYVEIQQNRFGKNYCHWSSEH